MYISGLLLIVGVLLCGCTGTSEPETKSIPAGNEPASNPVMEEEKNLVTPEETVAPKETIPEKTGELMDNLSFAEKMEIIQKRVDAQPPIVMKIGTTTDIYLEENPTTGYSWNATVTDGLKVVNDSYSQTSDMKIGGGGDRHWTIEGMEAGNQTFSAVYKRPWEEPSPDDATYTELFTVVE